MEKEGKNKYKHFTNIQSQVGTDGLILPYLRFKWDHTPNLLNKKLLNDNHFIQFVSDYIVINMAEDRLGQASANGIWKTKLFSSRFFFGINSIDYSTLVSEIGSFLNVIVDQYLIVIIVCMHSGDARIYLNDGIKQ